MGFEDVYCVLEKASGTGGAAMGERRKEQPAFQIILHAETDLVSTRSLQNSDNVCTVHPILLCPSHRIISLSSGLLFGYLLADSAAFALANPVHYRLISNFMTHHHWYNTYLRISPPTVRRAMGR